MKKLAALLALLGIVGMTCWYWFRTDTKSRPSATSPSRISALRLGFEAPYRLRPDTRFLLAVPEIQHMLDAGKSASQPVEAEFRAGGWTIRLEGKEIGNLSNLPDFSESLQFLSAWASRILKEGSIQFSRLPEDQTELQNEVATLDTLRAVLHADQQWQQGSREMTLLHSAGSAMAILAAQSLDQVEAADLVPARALALLAIQKAIEPSAARREECLLAQVLGYSKHAYQQAAHLSPEDPVRAYIRHEDDALAKLSVGSSTDDVAWFFQLKRLSDRRDLKKWSEAVRRTPDKGDPKVLPLLKTGVELGQFQTEQPMALRMVGAVMGEMKQWVKMTAERHPGPFFDSKLLQTYYRGFLYSALHKLGTYYRDRLSSTDATADFDKLIGEGTDLLAGEYRDWFHHLAEAKAGRGKVAELRADLTALSRFGGPMLFETYEQIKELLPFGDASLKDAVKELAMRLDSRPVHRFRLAWILYNDLLALGPAETLAASATQTQHLGELSYQAWFARLNGDHSRLQTLLALPDLTVADKVDILRQLNDENGPTETWVDEQYAQLLRSYPDEWRVASAYADQLERRKEFAKAHTIVQSWLNRKVKEVSALDYTFARTALARMYQLQGQLELGLRAIDHPDVDGWQFGAMERKALLLAGLGRATQSEQLAAMALARYPDQIEATALLVELYWMHGKYEAAAELLVNHPYPISALDWRFSIGRRFAAVFKDRPAEALAAEEVLRNKKLDPFMVSTQFALELYKAGSAQLAFEIQSRQRTSGLKNLLYKAKAYMFLKQAKGKDAALRWLQQEVPDFMRAPLCMFALPDKTHELLWEFAPSNLDGDEGAYYWLARAAAFVTDGGDSQDQKRLLDAQFAKAAPGHYHLIGRYLLGKASESELLAEAVDQKKSNEIYYFIGLKAKVEGRYRDAADWFWLTTEAGTINNGETRWAFDQLYLWMQKGKSLRILAEEDRNSRTTINRTPVAKELSSVGRSVVLAEL